MKQRELQDLIISWLTISLAFSYYGRLANLGTFFYLFPISLIAVGTGFVAHELAHRTVARRYGCYAEFRMWPFGLVLALLFSLLFGVVFAAPGAVYVYGPHISRRQNAKISLAGPLTNALIGILFLIIFVVLVQEYNTYVGMLIYRVSTLNLWFAVFNLIPFPPLDGNEVAKYFPGIWALLFFGTLGLLFFIGYF
ncbi:MAG: site-2 protease family protein [Candidatus Diapherotrites archaeon]